MTLQELLASLLNPNGQGQAAPQMGGAPAQVGDHNNPALLMQAQQRLAQPPQMPQQTPQQQPMPPQAPQGQPMPQAAPQAPQPQGGGLGNALGGILQNIITPQAAGKNKTVGWLTTQGLDPGTATVLASDKGALRSFILSRSQGKTSEFDQRARAAQQYGLDPTTPEGRNFILTGSIAKPESDKPTTDIQNFQFAKQNGYQGSFEQWTKDNKAGVNVNLPGSPNIGTIPPGYAAKQDPATGAWSMAPIAGGPEDPTKVDAAKLDQAAQVSDVITGAAGKIRKLAKEPGATGLVGAAASYLPGSPAAEVYRQVDVLKSNATISNLNAMRASSPTGGALGNVTEKEGAMLAAKSGALDPKSPYFQQQLDDYERTLLRVVHGKDAGDKIFEQTRGAQDQGYSTGDPAATTPSGQRVIQQMTNPQPMGGSAVPQMDNPQQPLGSPNSTFKDWFELPSIGGLKRDFNNTFGGGAAPQKPGANGWKDLGGGVRIRKLD